MVSTHADPSNSSQMQLETPGGAGVSCPCERRATVGLKPKTDTGGFVCSKVTGMQPSHSPPNYPTGFTITTWNEHLWSSHWDSRKEEDTAQVLSFHSLDIKVNCYVALLKVTFKHTNDTMFWCLIWTCVHITAWARLLELDIYSTGTSIVIQGRSQL